MAGQGGASGASAPGGRLPAGGPDLARMRRERHARLQGERERAGAAALLLLSPGNVRYATGAALMGGDGSRFQYLRAAALVVAGEAAPHLFTPHPEGAPPELPPGHLHPAPFLESGEGVLRFAASLRGILGARPAGPVALDETTPPMLFGLAAALGAELADAGPIAAAARLCKTPDEIECIRRAQRINELAMLEVQAALRPGLRETDLSALFLRRIFELGATGNVVDPIWQVMPERLAEGPWTVHGDVPFPTAPGDRILRESDLLWVDTGIDYEGYASDFGRTWLVGQPPRPSPRQLDQARRWRSVLEAVLEAVRPGVSGLELVRRAEAANGGARPWPSHFYLCHGIGTESAEMPFLGTDLGPAFDESVVLEPGMVLVLEPAIWDDGCAGFRAEEIVAVGEAGWTALSDHPHPPFEEAFAA
jgi:Xaa-Pro aminopeptidase